MLLHTRFNATSGGVTTVIDMPLNAIPPTTTVANFQVKLDAAKGQCYVDVGFWGGVIPDNHVRDAQAQMKLIGNYVLIFFYG